jgi:hypothetical protein
MEAFISPITRYDDFPEEVEIEQFGGVKRRSREYSVGGGRRRSRDGVRAGNDARRRRSRNRDRESYSARRPVDDWYSGSKTAGEEEYGHGLGIQGHHGRERDNDPFRGF